MKNLYIILIMSLFTISFNGEVFAELRTSITQYGITWTFSGQYECGQFITGDWWVVGPVTINSVSPTPTSGRNGSCINPMPGTQGYDSRRTPYGSTLSISYPYTLQPNQSLVSSASKPDDFPDASINGHGVLNDQAILTVVSAPVVAGTFRPGYSGTYKRYFTTSQVNMAAIPNITPPASTPSASEIIAYTERPRIDHIGSCWINNLCAQNNWYNGPGQYTLQCYGRDYSTIVSVAAMYAMLNTPEKVEIVYNLIQWGIDNYSVLKAGGSWIADGGHNNARKFPIVFSAVLLNDTDMLQVGTEYANLTGEDNQTYYGNNGKALWGKLATATYFMNGCSGGGAKDARDPAGLVDGCPDYRNGPTSPTWVGQMLAILMINSKSTWGHNAFFDYIDRWMTDDVSGGGYVSSPFVDEMWDLYRNNLPVGGGDPIPVSSVSLSPSTLTLEPGISSDLTETVLPANATNKGIVWSSSNTLIATVDANGNVTAVTEGNATITVATDDGNYTANCSVTVNSASGDYNMALNKTVTTTTDDGSYIGAYIVDNNLSTRWSAEVYPQSATIDLGEECNISRLEVYTYLNRAYQYIIEASSDGTNFIQIVNRNSNTTATQPISDVVSANGRYVKITVNGASGYTGTWISITELKVFGTPESTTIPVSAVIIVPTSLTLDIDQTSDLTETVSPSNATNKSVTWSSSNTSVATVSTDGLVTAIAAGTATITTTTSNGNFTANCVVTVNPANGLPSPWTNADIGAVAASGSTTYSNGTFTVQGAGANIWGTADEFQYVYQQITGDATITARLNTLTNTNQWTKGGVMMRENLNANSINGNTFFAPIATNGSKFSYRTTAGATCSEIDGPNVTAPYWIRMQRVGNIFTTFTSMDGSTWTTMGSTTINMATTYYVGLSVTSLVDGTLATATFDNVTVQLTSIISVTSVLVAPTSLNLNVGSTSDLAETVFPANATNNTVVWSSSNTSVATVNSSGLVTAVAPGNATITVTTNDGGLTANCVVIVTVPVSSVSISTSSLNLDIAQTSDLNETVLPANATNKTVVWSSSNTSVATVSTSGLVTAVAGGYATITVTTTDGGFTGTCAVSVIQANGLPYPWSNGDIGAVAASGSTTYSNGTFTVQGAGANIWGTADEFQYVYQQIIGDATITARLNTLTNTNQWTKGGVMMRENLNANSINGNTFFAPIATNGSKFSYRTTAGATCSEIDGPNVTAPYWIRMQRVGNIFTTFTSIDGSTWTTMGSTTINMATTYYVGLSVTSLVDGTLATATFDNVTIEVDMTKSGIILDTTVESKAKMKIYPNPCLDGGFMLSVSGLNSSKTATYRIFDMYGKIQLENQFAIEESGTRQFYINVNGLKAGLYVISVFDGSNTMFEKFVIK